MKPSLNKCPVCGDNLLVARYHCDTCDTVIEGRFENSAFPGLTAEQIEFVKTFVRCEGKINRMEGGIEVCPIQPSAIACMKPSAPWAMNPARMNRWMSVKRSGIPFSKIWMPARFQPKMPCACCAARSKP